MEAIRQKQKSSPSSCYSLVAAVAAVCHERQFEAYASPMPRLKNRMNNLAAGGSTAGMSRRSFRCRHRLWGSEPSSRNFFFTAPAAPKAKKELQLHG